MNSNGLKTCIYKCSDQGEIYRLLLDGIEYDKSVGARMVLGTPLLYFLDNESLYNALQTCKLWWAEFYSPEKLKFFFGIQIKHRDNALIKNYKLPRYVLNKYQRRVFWRLAILGEYEVTDIEFFSQLSPDNYVESLSRISSCNAYKSDYLNLTSLNASNVSIKKDIDRTFPQRIFFHRESEENWGKMQTSLWKLLMYIASKTNFGYCQGLNFIAATFLQVFDGDDILAVRCLNQFLRRPDIGPLFSSDFSLAQAYCRCIDFFLEKYLPSIALHLNSINLKASTYAFHWILTLLSYDFPFDTLVYIWDQLFLVGPRIIIQVLLGLLELSSVNLKNSSFEKSLEIIKNMSQQISLSFFDIVYFVNRFPLPDNLQILHS